MTAVTWALLLLLALPAGAQDLEPLVIVSPRWSELPKNASRSVTAVGGETLERRLAASAPEALREEPGLLVQQTMPGQSAVSVRGLIGKDNLVLIDGVRLNNATAANIQSLSLIDLESIESIEVLRGPGSVLYGGDALGGVVYLVPKRRQSYERKRALGGRLSGTYRSADDGRQVRGELQGNLGSFGFLGGLSGASFVDRELGKGLGTARPTAYRSRAADLALDWRGDKTVYRLTWQHALQSAVPRYDQYAQARRYGAAGRFAEFTFDPQRRDLLIVEAKAEGLGAWVDSLESRAYWQRQEESSRQRRTTTSDVQNFRDVVDSFGARLEAASKPRQDVLLTYGVDAHGDRVASGASGTGAAPDYPDGSRYESLGLFGLGQWTPSEAWALEAGARYNHAWIDSELRSGALSGHFTDEYRSLTGGMGAVWRPNRSTRIWSGVWQGFRPPNLNETAALKAGPGGLDAPTAGLRPERSLGFDLGLGQELGPVRHSLTFFHSILKDRIERVPGTFNGAAVVGGAAVFQRANVTRGYIQGVEWEGKAALPRDLSVRASGSWSYGRDSSAGTALTRVPPPMALIGLGWDGTAGRKPWAEAFARMAARQRRLSPADLADARIDPAGTAGWMTWNARAGIRPTLNTRLTLSVENLFDRAYREHASGVDAAGLNVTCNLQLYF